jgi:hypothetical protein
MCKGIRLAIGLVAGLMTALIAAEAARAQNNNNNVNNFIGTLPAGVFVSPEGVLRVKTFADKSGSLTRMRIAEAKARLGGDLAKPSELRKVSLNRLEAAIAEKIAKGESPTDEMKYLAGLTQIQYVFFYPDTKDIVVAGPAEGYFLDPAGRTLGVNSGRAILELQDLVAALRAFPPEGKQTNVISVSIDPTQEGLQAMQRWLAEIAPRVGPGDADAIVAGLKEKLGLHNVSVIVGATAAQVAARRRPEYMPPALIALQQHDSRAWFRDLRVREFKEADGA